MSPALLAAVFSVIPVIFLGEQNWDMLIAGYVTLFVSALLSLSIGLASSMMTRRTTVALAISYALTIVIFWGADSVFLRAWTIVYHKFYFGGSYLRGLQQDLYARGTEPDNIQLALSPIVALLRNAEGARYRLAGIDMGPWSVSMAIAIAFGVSTIFVSVRIFKRYKMTDR